MSLHANPKLHGQALYCPQHKPQLAAGITVNPNTQERRMLFAAADIELANQ